MKYKIEIDYISNACGLTYWPEKFFCHRGNPIEALNYRINQIIKKREHGLNKQNIEGARLYIISQKGEKIDALKVNYRTCNLEANLKGTKSIKDFWIKGLE